MSTSVAAKRRMEALRLPSARVTCPTSRVVTGRTNGRSVRETTVISEQEDAPVAMGRNKVRPHHSPGFGRRKSKAHKGNCVIS
ncbi:hypothetical protein PF005_g15951 [Phytophthora fragariae]|uniref:Uncharacterized protein n=1 Tax=Phytophthora fragariae TaxID=53985 RepID=A0A6A3XFX9_9STRA|nr:hypothetical protein PF003_g39599 [Phytophthora fragariae]KAE8929585.1 hypothetical protein PF009_g20304 [Phytophthora fragariae]KAE8990753.1 hypothetical protein PF011_g18219 [Phytophthora fragariae]KAE9089859.1 hypothetical protein PF007_g19455 [Phytophthora fragariae]KAE9134093.1 hypothetical protein PF006_g14897 [Phytophthora fragariae]